MNMSEPLLVRVQLVPPNKDYIYLVDTKANRYKFPRQHARYVQAGDICWLTSYRNRQSLKLLTDEDEIVIMDTYIPKHKSLVPLNKVGHT